MPERIRKNQRQREFVKGAEAAGNEVIIRGLPFAITVPRGTIPTQDNVKFIWVKRPTRARRSTRETGLTKHSLKAISILEIIGLGKMVVRI